MMRLIDANELYDLIDGGFDLNFDEVPETKAELLRMIAEQPVIEERKKGKWIEKDEYNDTYYECSACGASWVTIEGTPQDNHLNFCPNCGADMRSEE